MPTTKESIKKTGKRAFSYLGSPAGVSTIMNLLLLGGASFLGYKIYKKLTKERDPEAKETQVKALKKLKDETVKCPALSGTKRLQLTGKANLIYGALKNSAMLDSKGIAERELTSINTDCDITHLILFYGIRKTYIWGFPEMKMTLPEIIRSGELSNKRINRINNTYAKRGMKFRW